MATFSRLAGVVALVVAASTAAAAQTLKPEWSRPVGGKTRFVGVEEYGRCSVFVDNGAIQVVAPSGQVAWSWPFQSISKYLKPREVAVSNTCDAIAFVGDASYKYVWVVDRTGMSASIKLSVTPADVTFDRQGEFVAVGTYAGSVLLYSRNGALQWDRQTKAAIVQRLRFTDDNGHIAFSDWSGSGFVSLAGHVEFSSPVPQEERDYPSLSDYPYHRWLIAMSDDDERFWLRGEDSIDCLNRQGEMLATIAAKPGERGVRVSRDFSQVLVVSDKNLTPVSVERYVIPAPCRN